MYNLEKIDSWKIEMIRFADTLAVVQSLAFLVCVIIVNWLEYNVSWKNSNETVHYQKISPNW